MLEDIDQRSGGLITPGPAPLGALLGALGAVLGASWAPLEAFLGYLGAPKSHRKRNGDNAKHIHFL